VLDTSGNGTAEMVEIIENKAKIGFDGFIMSSIPRQDGKLSRSPELAEPLKGKI
jgi:hypothetical protein